MDIWKEKRLFFFGGGKEGRSDREKGTEKRDMNGVV